MKSARISDLPPECATASRAVRAALLVIGERRGATEVLTKGHLDIATGTDAQSQAAIQDVLHQGHPEIAFVGEEGELDKTPAAGSYWLVDPICGTRNFASEIPLYSVNIALVRDGLVVAAAMGDGAHGQIFVAARGRGAWRLEPDGELVSIAASAASFTLSIDPGKPGTSDRERAAEGIGAAIRAGEWELRTFGTALDIAFVASGRLAGVLHFSQTHPLHFAAGALLAEEAGAHVTDLRGDPWRVGSLGFIAASPKAQPLLLGLAAGGYRR